MRGNAHRHPEEADDRRVAHALREPVIARETRIEQQEQAGQGEPEQQFDDDNRRYLMQVAASVGALPYVSEIDLERIPAEPFSRSAP